ncbi:hypothetical protein D9M70_543640 [compost metagenome]
MPRLGGEAAQVFLDRLAGGRHEMAEDEHLDALAHALESRNRREHGEGHRHHRHDGEQGGVGQGGGLVRRAVRHEAPDQVVPEIDQSLHTLLHGVSLDSRLNQSLGIHLNDSGSVNSGEPVRIPATLTALRVPAHEPTDTFPQSALLEIAWCPRTARSPRPAAADRALPGNPAQRRRTEGPAAEARHRRPPAPAQRRG